MSSITDKMMFTLPEFMASSNARKSERPRPLHLSKSFTRVGPASPDLSTRAQRASTIQNGVMLDGIMANTSRENRKPRTQPDAFEKTPEDDGPGEESSGKLPDDFDELPIELVSLSDRSVVQG